MELIDIFISIGSNIDNPKYNIDNAIKKLKQFSFFYDFKVSSYYITSPVDFKDQPNFINCAVWFKTRTDLKSVYKITKEIENDIGTFKTHKNGPRKIDLDLIFYGNIIYNSDKLTIPHIKMHTRKFVLIPICELYPNFYHPVLELTIQDILFEINKTNDESVVKI